MAKTGAHIAQYHLHKAHPEKLQFEIYDLDEYRRRSGAKAAVPHSHSYYQIIWFFENSDYHIVDFKTYEVQANTVLFIGKNQIHAFDEEVHIKGMLIHFNESFFMHTDVDMFLKYNIFNSTQHPHYSVDASSVEAAQQYVALMRSELKNRQAFGYEDVLRFLLKSLLIQLERLHQKDSEKTLQLSSVHEMQFIRFKELVESHYKEHLSVVQYADRLSVSSKTLATITKKSSGKSPSEVIKSRIILQAKRLLRFTSLSVGEIAFRLGFEDDSYFIKYFKKELEVSPLRFRESV